MITLSPREREMLDVRIPPRIPYFDQLSRSIGNTYDQISGIAESNFFDLANPKSDLKPKTIELHAQVDGQRRGSFKVKVSLELSTGRTGTNNRWFWFFPLISAYHGRRNLVQECIGAEYIIYSSRIQPSKCPNVLVYARDIDSQHEGFYSIRNLANKGRIEFDLSECNLRKVLYAIEVEIPSSVMPVTSTDSVEIQLNYTIRNFAIPSSSGNHIIWFYRSLRTKPYPEVFLELKLPEKYIKLKRAINMHEDVQMFPHRFDNNIRFAALTNHTERPDAGVFFCYTHETERTLALKYMIVGAILGALIGTILGISYNVLFSVLQYWGFVY